MSDSSGSWVGLLSCMGLGMWVLGSLRLGLGSASKIPKLT